MVASGSLGSSVSNYVGSFTDGSSHCGVNLSFYLLDICDLEELARW